MLQNLESKAQSSQLQCNKIYRKPHFDDRGVQYSMSCVEFRVCNVVFLYYHVKTKRI